ncbi:MAG TPA: ECF-type sigma factor [Gemmataceae bacterium]|nr:ECF-type sigma factor [Gemmataceae bacterium]
MSDQGSVTLLIDRLQNGDREALQKIWERFFRRLVGLARMKLGSVPRTAADEEDVALSALGSFFWAAEQGRFPKLGDRHDLWTVLLLITTRKACDFIQREQRAKRDWRKVEHDQENGNSDNLAEQSLLSRIIGGEPDPAFAAEMIERCSQLLDMLDDDELRTIAIRRLEGFTNEEIAAQLDCAVSTVERRLSLIRDCWWAERPS